MNTRNDSSPKRVRRPARPTVNLTPMIDVTFLLLVFFIVATVFVRPEGTLPGGLPALGLPDTELPPAVPIVIRLEERPHGMEIEVNRQVVSAGELPGRLGELAENGIYHRDRTPVIISPASRLAWQDVLTVYNTVLRARYREVAFEARRRPI